MIQMNTIYSNKSHSFSKNFQMNFLYFTEYQLFGPFFRRILPVCPHKTRVLPVILPACFSFISYSYSFYGQKQRKLYKERLKTKTDLKPPIYTYFKKSFSFFYFTRFQVLSMVICSYFRMLNQRAKAGKRVKTILTGSDFLK